MKRLFVLLFSLLLCNVSYADTETINWYVDGNSYATTTCQTGGDIILPTMPIKYGYTFQGWVGYTPIEYLESTGTQYIDTGYIPKKGTKFEIRVQLLSSGTMDFAGMTDECSSNFYMSYFGPLTVSGNKCVYYFDNYHVTSASCRVNDTITASIYIRPSDGATIVQNNETLNQINTYSQSGNFLPTISLYLFAGHYRNKNKNCENLVGEYSVGKMFYAKILENNIVVHDFIPVLDQYGTPCMYDKVTKQYFYNQGTGDFIAGPVIN